VRGQARLDTYALRLKSFCSVPRSATVVRGSALSTEWPDRSFDAIITDPPYYDSRSYSNLSDHFYVWHKRSVGHLYSSDFAAQLTPKKTEAIAASYRHDGNRKAADVFYEGAMQKAFAEAHRLLKPGAPMVCVYAHKTTAGWTTLINAMRAAGFAVVEAWPIEMERKARQNALETAALASSILLVVRRREETETGSYERAVRPELENYSPRACRNSLVFRRSRSGLGDRNGWSGVEGVHQIWKGRV